MEDVRKWMERRLGSVPGLLAIIVTDRQILMSDDLFLKPIDTIMVALSPRIGVGPGSDSQGSVI